LEVFRPTRKRFTHDAFFMKKASLRRLFAVKWR
jgi:hypothetical protein